MSIPTEPGGPAPPPPAASPLPPAPPRAGGGFARALGWVIGTALVAAAAAAAAWWVVEQRLGAQVTAATAEVQQLRRELADRDTQLRQQADELNSELQAARQAMEARVTAVEKAAADAALLVQGAEGAQGLANRLAEIGALRDALARQQEETATRMQALEQSLNERIGQQGAQTAEALAADLRLRSLLIRTHGHVLKARVDLSEGNRGLAREELALAAQSLSAAVAAAPEARKPQVEELPVLLEQARTALILESATVRDHLDLLWHRISAQLAEP